MKKTSLFAIFGAAIILSLSFIGTVMAEEGKSVEKIQSIEKSKKLEIFRGKKPGLSLIERLVDLYIFKYFYIYPMCSTLLNPVWWSWAVFLLLTGIVSTDGLVWLFNESFQGTVNDMKYVFQYDKNDDNRIPFFIEAIFHPEIWPKS
ncbi:MAG: hypothetical protein DRN18_03525 [Thermoplasmata archaeon]|nr:MAG: hypothetical protein DRN18_03525 [Thermoplasmata archaeon]